MTYYEKILATLQSLKNAHPKCNMAKHLATALEDNFWGMTDKELLDALERYKDKLSLDVNHSDDEIEQIIRDGMNLTLHEDEEDD